MAGHQVNMDLHFISELEMEEKWSEKADSDSLIDLCNLLFLVA